MSYNRNNVLLKIWNDNAFDAVYSKCLEHLSKNNSSHLNDWAENLFTVSYIQTDDKTFFKYRSAKKNAQLLFNIDVYASSFTNNLTNSIRNEIEAIMEVVASKRCAALTTIEDTNGHLIDLLLLPMASNSGHVILGQIMSSTNNIGEISKIHSMQYVWKNENNDTHNCEHDKAVIFLQKNKNLQRNRFGQKH